MPALYDEIGKTYAATRRQDPAIMAAIEAALGDCESVLNVGAGSGSYEPAGRDVLAVEPSLTMIKQRPPSAAAAVQARSDALPFCDGAFAAVLAVLTVHHWSDLKRGLAECARVARDRSVFLTFDVDRIGQFWLLDYFPTILAIDRGKAAPLSRFSDVFTAVTATPVPIAGDCRDGFLGAYWRRPEAYLDASVRAGISSFAKLDAAQLEAGLHRLRTDLRSGAWAAQHADLMERDTLDIGYRLMICRTAHRSAHQ
jgi:SAM-dependent methyltransferase